jgi:hypothetical protein
VNNLSRPFLGVVARLLCALTLGVPLCVLHARAAQASETCDLRFHSIAQISTAAEESAVAANSSGYLVSAFRNLDAPNWGHGQIVCRLGKLQPDGTVMWGKIQGTGLYGHWPAVAISKEGYIVFVYNTTDSNERRADLFYRVGAINLNGDLDQWIDMKTDVLWWDAGYNAGIAMNDSGAIVGVHESGLRGGDGIYYRVGQFMDPAGGDLTINWVTGEWGIKYDTGINPRIAINNYDEVVSVHQVPGESLLHYRAGIIERLEGAAIGITFGDSRRYDDYGSDASVALLDSGLVLEVHRSGSGWASTELRTRTGWFNWEEVTSTIAWDEQVVNPVFMQDSPAIAAAGTFAVETHTGSFTGVEPRVHFSVAPLCESYGNGALVKGSGEKVYVVLNDYRYWIPDGDTFRAMGYDSNNIREIPDHDLYMIPAGGELPSVPPLSGDLKYKNGTIVKGSSEKVYAVYHNYRYWIPDRPTFEALRYDWSQLKSLFDPALNAIPEVGRFPSVAR